MAFADFFKSVAPKYCYKEHKNFVDIHEHDAGATLKKLRWQDSDFFHMDHQLAKDLTSFFQMAKSPKVFNHDCDGVILFEHDGKKYMFLNELKSGFDTGKILEAKEQIVSTFLKTNMLLHLFSCYKLEDYTVKGFIVSRPPKKDFKINCYQMSMVNNKKGREYDLTRKLVYCKDKCFKFRPCDINCIAGLPLGDRGIFKSIELHYIEVKESHSETTLSVIDYI